MRWYTGCVEREGMQRYVHLIRAEDDPRDDDRPRGRAAREAGYDRFGNLRAVRKADVDQLAARIVELLEDGRPRTAHRIMVDAFGVSADAVFDDAPDQALWRLVDECRVEHTAYAPILFRIRRACSDEMEQLDLLEVT